MNTDNFDADFECEPEHAFVLVTVTTKMQKREVKFTLNKCFVKHESFDQCAIEQAIKKFDEAGKMAEMQEFKQSHDRKVFELINVKNLTSLKRKHVLKSLMFIEKKCDGRLKERTCANGSEQRH